MPAPVQTLAAGESLQQQMTGKYQLIGVKGQELLKPLNRAFCQVIGRYAAGKSRLVQTNAKAIVINADESPTTTDSVQAEIWPLVGPDGTTDADGAPLLLTFPLVLSVVDKLLTARRSRLSGVPEMVIFDSLPSLVQLAVEYATWKLINDANRRRSGDGTVTAPEIPPEQITHFDLRSLYGGTVYDTAYGEVMRMINNLRHAGFGVTVVTQLEHKVVKIGTNLKTGENIEAERFVLGVTDALLTRMWRYLDLSVIIERRVEISTREVKHPGQRVKGPSGATLTLPERVETIEEPHDVAMIVTRSQELARFLKVRAGVPSEFKINNWSDLETTYNGA